jgi:hypothetical protein
VFLYIVTAVYRVEIAPAACVSYIKTWDRFFLVVFEQEEEKRLKVVASVSPSARAVTVNTIQYNNRDGCFKMSS